MVRLHISWSSHSDASPNPSCDLSYSVETIVSSLNLSINAARSCYYPWGLRHMQYTPRISGSAGSAILSESPQQGSSSRHCRVMNTCSLRLYVVIAGEYCPKGPCRCMVYTLGPEGFPYTYLKAQVYTIYLHGPFGCVFLGSTSWQSTFKAEL